MRRGHKLLIRTACAVGVLAALAAAALLAASWWMPLPPALLRPAAGTPELLDREGKILARLATDEARASEPRSLEAMGRWLPRATVALEDHRFYEHGGIDFRAHGAALVRNARAGRVVSGASTITQQVIKLASGRRGRSPWAKLYENLAALRLERLWTKERILEEYLNRSHYGNRQIGAVAAARAYFRKDPAHLTLPEAVFLAGLPQAPSRFNPWRNPAAAAGRFARCAARLQALDFIPAARWERLAHPPAVAPAAAPPRRAPHFIDAVLRRHGRCPTARLRPRWISASSAASSVRSRCICKSSPCVASTCRGGHP